LSQSLAMSRAFSILLFCVLGSLARAAAPVLLESAIENWLGERDHWAFTQRAIEYQNGTPHERLERYDPSQPTHHRWQLISLDGKWPTLEQRLAWEKKKLRKVHRKFDTPIGDYFDFDHAKT